MMVLGTHVDTKKNSTNGEEMFNDIKEAVFGKACGRVIELGTRTQWLDKLREVIKKQVATLEGGSLETRHKLHGQSFMRGRKTGVQLD